MKILMLESLSGDEEHKVGEEYTFSTDEAIRLIDAGIAKPKSQKEYEVAIKKINDAADRKLEDEKKAAAILYKDELLSEKQTLLSRVEEINNDLEIKEVVISKDEHEKLLKREPKEDEEQK